MKKYGKILLLWFLTLFSPCALRAQKENAEQKVRKNDIKITLLSIGSGSTRLTYERAFTPRTSAELTVGIIGLGVDWIHHTKSRGYLLKLAYKWNVVPMVKANSPLAGFYLKLIMPAHCKGQCWESSVTNSCSSGLSSMSMPVWGPLGATAMR